MMARDDEDLTNAYSESVRERSLNYSVQGLEQWADMQAPQEEGKQPKPQQERPHDVPEKPQRRTSSSDVGTPDRQKERAGALATTGRSMAEIPKQALGGIDDAARNVFKLPFMQPLDQLGNWIDERLPSFLTWDKVAEPKTSTGAFTRKLSEFLTGFIPAIKGLRMLGATSTVAPTMLAAAISDMAVRDPHEGRLSDLWREAGLPANILTDYLASDENDTDSEARLKNAAESVLTGYALEGVLQGARGVRALMIARRKMPEVADAEAAYLKQKYGEIVDPAAQESRPIHGFVVDAGDNGSTTYRVIQPKGAKGKWRVEQKGSEGEKDVTAFDTKAEAEAHLKKLHADVEAEIKSGDLPGETITSVTREKINLSAADKELSAAFRRVVGDPSKPGIEIVVRKPSQVGKKVEKAMEDGENLAPRSVIRGRGTGLPDDYEVYINFANIDTPDKVKFTIGKMAEAFKSQIDEAKRGVITHKETEELADKMGMTVTDLLARRKGQAFNAEEALAARNLWVSSGENLLELAKRAAGPNAGPLDQYAFRKGMALHASIQAEVLGARAEGARALNAWKISADGGIERARSIQQTLEAMGGPKASAEMARRLAILAESGDAHALGNIVERGWGAASVDAFKEAWVNGLLASPKTHIVNITSNTAVALQQIYERGAAAAIRGFVGGEGVVAGEATAMAFGLIESTKDAFRMAAKALKTGESGWAFNKIDLVRPKAISADAFRMSQESGMGRFVDFLGTATNVPGRLLGAEDEFFKTIAYRMEVRAQALRTATQEGKVGRDLAMRIKELSDAPTEAMRINAADSALYSTFTNEMGAFGKAMMNLRNIDHPLNPLMFVLPFIRTPVNICRYAFERTPFAPLVSQWRADVAAGGARADIALARMSTGTAIMLAAMDMADSGLITGDGPRDKDKELREAYQRQGVQFNSFKVGDRWFSYNRTDPMGMTLGFAANIAEAVRHGEIAEDQVDEWHEVVAMAIAAVAQVTINKTYLEGFAKLVEVMGDSKRYSKQYVMDLTASFVPLTSLSNAIKNWVDPVQREAGTPWEAVQARIAGLSDNLPPRRTLWGEPITSESGLGKFYDFTSPLASKQQVNSPIDKELVRMNAGPDKIKQNTPFDGVQVNMRFWPKAYDDYVRLAGNDLKHPAWGLGAKDYLNAVVSGQHPMSAAYNIMSDESRKAFIQNTISDYRALAQQEVLNDPKHAGFAAEVEKVKEMHRGANMPVL